MSDVFRKAKDVSETDYMCFINADIILLPDFIERVKKVIELNLEDFLMVGRRYTVEIKEMIDFSNSDWAYNLKNKIIQDQISLDPPTANDYFVFPKGKIDMPEFAIGRTVWDNWTLWDAKQRGSYLIDATNDITIVHPKHDYGHLKDGAETAWKGEEAMENLRIAGGYRCMCNILDASHLLINGKIKKANTFKHLYRKMYQIARKIKHKALTGALF